MQQIVKWLLLSERPMILRRLLLAMAVMLLALLATSSFGCAHKPKVRIVTVALHASQGTNEGRPMTVVIQESASFAAGPPSYDEVVGAASQGKPLLAKGIVYPGHETSIQLVDVAIDTQIFVSALYTAPPDRWQQVVNLGKREKISVYFGMRGIE